jgi:hypothetical protein
LLKSPGALGSWIHIWFSEAEAESRQGLLGSSELSQPHISHSKLLHKRDSDKVDAQEENFLPKYQRVKDLCQRAEYQTACEQLGQVRFPRCSAVMPTSAGPGPDFRAVPVV